MLMRNTSAPASNRRAIIAALPEAGPSVATILVRRRRLISAGPFGNCDGDLPARRRQHRRARCQRPLLRPFGGVGELHRPGALLAGVDLEEAGAVEAARQAILGALDGEFLVARAHEGLARPFAAAVVVDRVDVIEARDQRSLEHGLAGARRQIPPAFGDPAAVGVLVADRDADPAAGVVAQMEIGPRLPATRQRQRERRRDQQKSARARRESGEGQGACYLLEGRYRVKAYGLSTTMARKSFTLVQVGPVSTRSPSRLKNPVESLSARKWAGSRPSRPRPVRAWSGR